MRIRHDGDSIHRLQNQYVRDYQIGLLTREQLANLIHRLDRIAASIERCHR